MEAYLEKHSLSIYASGLHPWRKSQNFLIRRLPKCCRHCNHILFTHKQFFVVESTNCIENFIPIYATCCKTQYCGTISRKTPCNEKHFRPSSLRRIIHFCMADFQRLSKVLKKISPFAVIMPIQQNVF